MGCRILVGQEDGCETSEIACLFCSTTGIAFGPVFRSHQDARDFDAWCTREKGDPRIFSAAQLVKVVAEWRSTRPEDPQ